MEEARKLLPRGLQSLEKRKRELAFYCWFLPQSSRLVDLKTISQFALLEYKHGDPERGKTLFEGIIDSHPKRWDMWSVYMDMEGTQKNIQNLRYVDPCLALIPCAEWRKNRNLFGRVFALKMTSHKAKSVRFAVSSSELDMLITCFQGRSSKSGLNWRRG